ncbi:Metalloenzyme, LuxS/M16 peptidase-like protein, partial [Baffinella frigidus]
GLPHCLEHLVFMGSESYPNRGFLDKLANLCISQGTNAWTDRDHTAYNAVCAGPVGLRRLLPVLIDHVLSPTLTDAQFATEVYHVDGEGAQKGVVFCEMQGRESTEDDLADINLYQLLYPASPYSFECGGLTPDIATLSNEEVRAYHARFYTPENCLVLVHGLVPIASIQEALDEWYDQWLKRQGGASPNTPEQVVSPPSCMPRFTSVVQRNGPNHLCGPGEVLGGYAAASLGPR